MEKFPNYEAAWAKMDLRNNGYLTFPTFEQQARKLKMGMTEEELNVVF